MLISNNKIEVSYTIHMQPKTHAFKYYLAPYFSVFFIQYSAISVIALPYSSIPVVTV